MFQCLEIIEGTAIIKIVSGEQTGVDQAGLGSAREG